MAVAVLYQRAISICIIPHVHPSNIPSPVFLLKLVLRCKHKLSIIMKETNQINKIISIISYLQPFELLSL